MPTSYTSLLGLALPVTGELSGTWGDTVNDYITRYVDAAVAGAQTISGSQTAVTLSTTNGSTLSQAGAGATGSAQYAIINCTGNPAGLLTVTAPATSKAYLVINATSTNQSVKVVGSGPTTGVTIAASRAALIAWNGSDFRLIATTDASQLSGILAVANGGTGLSSGTSGGVPYFSATTTMASSAALAANAIVLGGGAGAAPATTTTGTGVVTAIGNAVNTSGGLVTQSGTLAASSLLLGGGASTAISSTTTGTGVVTALGTNVGSAGAFVVNGGALGTPSSGTVTNLTGTASININGTVGATTPNTGAFTSITSTSASGILTRAAANQDGVHIYGRAGGTSNWEVVITPTTLTADRTLTLPDNTGTILTTGATVTVAQGGTGLTSGTSGGIPYFSSTSAMTSSGVLAANALMIGGGAGAAPSTITTGTGVVTALGVNTGTAGAFVVNGGALGTPSSGTVTNLTGTASININGTVGATTPNTGAFTTLTSNDAVTFSATTQNIALGTSQTSGTWTAGGASQTGTITLDQSTKAHTLNIGTGATENLTTKTINIGTAGVSGSTTAITIGSSVSGATSNITLNTSGNVTFQSVDAGATAGPILNLYRNSSSPAASDVIGQVLFQGKDSVGNDQTYAYIQSGIEDATSTSEDGNIQFFTTAAGTTAERMRLDAVGNLGVGTTPSTRLHVAAASANVEVRATTTTSGDVRYGFDASGAYYNWIETVRSSGAMRFATANTEVMRITSGGDLLVGATSNAAAKVRVTVGGSAAGVRVDGITGSNQDFYALRNGASTIQDGPNITLQSASGTTYATTMQMGPTGETLFFNYNGSAWNERARITSGGELLVGTTTNALVSGYASKVAIQYTGGSALYGITLRPNTDTTTAISFCKADGTTVVGSISQTTTATAYNTSSDYRLKENVQPMTGALSRVAALKPCTYTWKVDGSFGEGFIAHEVADVYPQAVSGEKDAVDEDGKIKPQGVDYGKLTPLLTAALQEAMKEIESLKARIAALEAA